MAWLRGTWGVIADGIADHDGLSAVTKLVKLFVESSTAGVHLED